MIKKLIVLSALFIVHVIVHSIIGGMARTIMESVTENQGTNEKNLYECQRELITFYDDSLRKEYEEVIRFLEQFVHKNYTNDSSGHTEEMIKRNRILTKQTTFQEIFM